MANIQPEQVTKRWYEWTTKEWKTTQITIKLMPEMFSEGALRQVHHMLICHPTGAMEPCVAKQGKGEGEDHDTSVIMQAACQRIAAAFNACHPPRPVQLIDCFTVQRKDRSVWAVETFLPGKYVKHNNNFGYVREEARNTPQAFSHFSYEFTGGRLMVVDMQGVGDYYTDPQLHTMDGEGFGAGNMGRQGIVKFLNSHRCNSLCTFLQLSPIRGPQSAPERISLSATFTDTAAVCMPRQEMRVSEFIGNLQPVKGSCRPEELALLGLTARQFNALVHEFNALDPHGTGRLTPAGLGRLRQRSEAAGAKGELEEGAEAFMEFFARAQDLMAAHDGALDFRAFVLCWTDNQ